MSSYTAFCLINFWQLILVLFFAGCACVFVPLKHSATEYLNHDSTVWHFFASVFLFTRMYQDYKLHHTTHKKHTHTKKWSRASITAAYALQCVHACNQNPQNLMIFCCCVSTRFTAPNSIMPRSKSRLFRLSSAQSQRHWRRFAHSSTLSEVRAMKSTSARVTACRLSRGGLFQSNLNLRPNFQ